MAKRFPLYPIIPPLCWPCRIKFVCPISHYIPMISPWNHCIHRLNYCKSIPMVVPRHIYIFKRLSLCMCVNMRDFMWSILGFLTLYPLNSINSHYTIYMYRIIYIYMYIIVYHCISMIHHCWPPSFQHFSCPLDPVLNGGRPGGAGSTSNQPLRSLDTVRPETPETPETRDPPVELRFSPTEISVILWQTVP